MERAIGGGVELCPDIRVRLTAYRRRIWRWLGSILLAMAVGWGASELPAQPIAGAARVRIIVKPKATGKLDPTNVVAGSRLHRRFARLGNMQVIDLPPGVPAQTAVNFLRATKEFEYAEVDQVIKLQGTEPNDFRYATGELWGLHNTGYLGGTPGADIHAPAAWDIRHDAPNVVVALVDSGIRLTHEDLAPNLWRNPGEIPGNGIDDDGNGVIDDVHGFNAWADNGDPSDDLGHGSHVAGSIGGAGNNGVGVVGVAWKVQLMSTKFTDPTGYGTVSDAIACIEYARQMGADVINASWGATTMFDSPALHDAIAAARDAGIIFVTVAGNDAGNNDAVPYYPGAFALDNMIVVTATDRNDQLAFFSNYGAQSVDLGAPGYNIFSCWVGSDSDYQYYNGGSMAVAHVSGAVALVRAQFPGLPYKDVIKRILDHTDPLPSLQGRTRTGGRLNLFKALGGTVSPATVSLNVTDATGTEGAADPAGFTISRTGATTAPLTVMYSAGGTASNGVDYPLLSGSAVIPAGAASVIISIQPTDDTVYEGNETVVLTLLAGAGYILGTAHTGTATLVDNDPPPLPDVSIQATDAAAAEAGMDTATFIVSRTGDVTTALTVHLSVSGTATSGDYQALTLPVVFPIGASAQTIVLRPIDDDVVEPTETVVLTLTPNAAYRIVGTGQITATITDNDVARPTVNVTATQPVASEAGAVGTFTITRTGSTASPLLVGLETGGTAKGGKDYEKIPTSVTIPAGAASVSVPVQPVNDKKKEGPETVQLKVLASAGYEIGASSAATITLTDDDTRERPTVSVQTLIPFALESGWVKSVVRFSRTGSSSEELKIKLAIDGTAKNGKDYERVANQITIPAGKLHADLEIEPLRDRKTESVETIVIGIDPHPKYVVGTNGQVQIRLFDAGALAEYLRKLAGRN